MSTTTTTSTRLTQAELTVHRMWAAWYDMEEQAGGLMRGKGQTVFECRHFGYFKAAAAECMRLDYDPSDYARTIFTLSYDERKPCTPAVLCEDWAWSQYSAILCGECERPGEPAPMSVASVLDDPMVRQAMMDRIEELRHMGELLHAMSGQFETMGRKFNGMAAVLTGN